MTRVAVFGAGHVGLVTGVVEALHDRIDAPIVRTDPAGGVGYSGPVAS
jgi:hypothetical protein